MSALHIHGFVSPFPFNFGMFTTDGRFTSEFRVNSTGN